MAETLPIDSVMIDRWTNQWMKQLGFNDEQLSKRTAKVEQFARVRDFFPHNSSRSFVVVSLGSYPNEKDDGYHQT